MSKKFPNTLLQLTETLKKLPGVGSRTAERYAFDLLQWNGVELKKLSALINALKVNVQSCEVCGCLAEGTVCMFCQNPTRDVKTLCVLASPKEVYPFEETGEYRGLYHILEGMLSPIDGRGPDEIGTPKLIERISKLGIKDVLLALDSTLEGDTTSFYIKEQLAPMGVKISRLAFGIPMGCAIDYVDSGTLARALQGRLSF